MKQLKIYQSPDFRFVEVIHSCPVFAGTPLSAGESTLHPGDGEASESEAAGSRSGIWDNEDISSSTPFEK